MSAPYTKTNPNWLSKQNPDDLLLNKKYKRSVIYYKALYQAWPEWCATDYRFKQIYDRAKELRSLGRNVHVDHIVPIKSDLVCGLHVPWNLEIIGAKENLKKSNNHWPNHPFEIIDLFNFSRCEQYDLPL